MLWNDEALLVKCACHGGHRLPGLVAAAARLAGAIRVHHLALGA